MSEFKKLSKNRLLHIFTDARQKIWKYHRMIEYLIQSCLAEEGNSNYNLYSITTNATETPSIVTAFRQAKYRPKICSFSCEVSL